MHSLKAEQEIPSTNFIYLNGHPKKVFSRWKSRVGQANCEFLFEFKEVAWMTQFFNKQTWKNRASKQDFHHQLAVFIQQ